MRLIKTATKRPIGTCTIFIVLIVFGIISLMKLKIALLPQINYPRLTIITLFQNVPPAEIENLITAPIEEAVMSVKGVRRVQSISRHGISVVVPVFKWGTNIDVASINVREKLDMIKNTLPDDITKPVITRFDPTSLPIIGLGIFWENKEPVFIKNLIEKEIKPELERIDGVAKVSVKGGVEEEIVVSVDLDRLNSYDVSLQQITDFVQNATYNFPAGNIIEGKKEYLIRVDGEYRNITDINHTIIGRSKSGGIVKVEDVANVYFGTKERTSYFLLDGKEGIGLEILKESNANDIEISRNVHKKIQAINEKFSSFLEMQLIFDSSEFIEEAISGLFIAGVLAILITFFVVLVFMKNYRLPVIIIITVPVSIIITFLCMFLNKMTLNIMSLGGLALGIGMLVDSSIVVIEEIEGKKTIDEIYQSTSRVAFSIIASTLTTLVVFVPLIFVKGIAGALFSQLALTISFALISSIIVSLFLIPVLYILIAKGEKARDPGWFKAIKTFFKRVLSKNIRNKKVIIIVSTLFFVLSVVIFLIIRKEFMPVVDRGEFYMKIAYKTGTPIEESKRLTAKIVDKIQEEKSVLHTFSSIGYDQKDPFILLQEEVGVHIAEIKVLLKNKRSENVFKLVERLGSQLQLRDDIKIVFEIPRNIIADLLNLDKADFTTEIYCEDGEKLDELARNYHEQLMKSGVFLELKSSKKDGKPQIRVSFDHEALAGSGISSKTIYDIMATAIKGSKAAVFRRDDDLIDIKVILDEGDRSDMGDLSRLNITTEQGPVPIFPFIRNEKLTSPSRILRNNQQEYIRLSGNFAGKKNRAARVIEGIQKDFIKHNARTTITGGDEKKETDDSFKQLIFAFLLSLFLVYAILASQFESLVRPLLIMFSVPLSFLGSLFVLYIFNKSINLNSIIGIVMLGGIVVNNSIILFDRYNYMIKTLNKKSADGVYYGTLNRFKPILMTSFTTIIGLVPMAIGIGRGGELQSSLALSVIGGLFISTILTLFLMPNLYHMTTKLKRK